MSKEKQGRLFRGWFLVFWIIGGIHLLLSLTMFPEYAELGIISIVLGTLLILVPFLIMIIKNSKNKTASVSPAASEPAVEPKAEPVPTCETVKLSFDVANADTRDRQKVLKKVYKQINVDDADYSDRPTCTMYLRGDESDPDYVVYLDGERIGDVPHEKCRELFDIGNFAKIDDAFYSIDDDRFDDELNDVLYSCHVTVEFKITKITK